MKITLKQLEVFIAIAKSQNVSQAAESVHLSQSACSMALSSLEERLGGALFDRQGKRLVLNERGRVLVTKAVNILTQVDELKNLMVENKKENLAGHLIVGASSTIGNYLLHEMIGRFLIEYPNAKITLRVGNTEQMIQQLLQFDIDIALIEGRCHNNTVTLVPWKKDELVIIASPQHSLAKKKKVTLNDLHHAKWILRETGSGTREKFEEAMKGKINPFLELGHTEAIKQAVRAGLGISCLSKATVCEALKSGELVVLSTEFLALTRNFYLLIHKEKYQTGILKALESYLQSA